MAKHIEKVIRTAEDLTTLEINTIVKRSMTGGKQPDDDKEALYKLAGIYSSELERLGNRYAKCLSEESEFYKKVVKTMPEEANLFRRVSIFKGGGVFSFREIGIWARYADEWLEDYDEYLINEESERIDDQYQLKRIAAKCLEMSKMIEAHFFKERDGFKILEGGIVKDSIKEEEIGTNEGKNLHPYFKKVEQLLTFSETTKEHLLGLMNRYLELKPHEPDGYNWVETDPVKFQDNSEKFQFDLRHRLSLRKSIDIGVEKILMQTRIGMDGDITTRLTQSFSEEPQQFILDIHNTSIRISVDFWEKIFDALMSLLHNVLKKR
jgi:hypothetical protein